MKKSGVSAHRFGRQEIGTSVRLSPATDFSQCKPDVNSATACISRSLILDAI